MKAATPGPNHLVVESKFKFLMHSEAKQTEMLEFGAEKGLQQRQARRTGSSCWKDPNSRMGFEEEFL